MHIRELRKLFYNPLRSWYQLPLEPLVPNDSKSWFLRAHALAAALLFAAAVLGHGCVRTFWWQHRPFWNLKPTQLDFNRFEKRFFREDTKNEFISGREIQSIQWLCQNEKTQKFKPINKSKLSRNHDSSFCLFLALLLRLPCISTVFCDSESPERTVLRLKNKNFKVLVRRFLPRGRVLKNQHFVRFA